MKVYILTETHEAYGIRDFNIISVRTDKERSKKEMEELVEADHYEDFKDNGIEDEGEMYCESGYGDNACFTAYHIIEKEVEE